jgi:hypothetical protein
LEILKTCREFYVQTKIFQIYLLFGKIITWYCGNLLRYLVTFFVAFHQGNYCERKTVSSEKKRVLPSQNGKQKKVNFSSCGPLMTLFLSCVSVIWVCACNAKLYRSVFMWQIGAYCSIFLYE